MGRHRRPRRSGPLLAALVVVAALGGVGALTVTNDEVPAPRAAAAPLVLEQGGRVSALRDPSSVNIGQVIAVLDGQTLLVALPGGTARVTVAGLDAPTGSECGAREATGHAGAALLSQTVTLLPDLSVSDVAGTAVRYVVLRSQVSYSDSAVQDGVARVSAQPVWYRDVYLDEQAKARAAGRGVWGRCAG